MFLCYRTKPVRTSRIAAMVVDVVLFPIVGGGTGSVPVGMSACANAPQVVASVAARIKFLTRRLIECSFTALIALHGD